MPATTIVQKISDVVMYEEENLYSRDALASAVFAYTGGGLQEGGCGMVVARKSAGAVTAVARAGNTGNGVLGTWTLSTGVRVGVYRAVALEPVTNLGTFALYGPDGNYIARIIVGTAYAGVGVAGTIADGATDWLAGDTIDITVAPATVQDIVPWVPSASDGSDEVLGIMLIANTVAIDRAVVLVRESIVKLSQLVWAASVTTQAQRDVAIAALNRMGIVTNRPVV